jgi:SAM-dependent methyltransferase
VSVVPQENIYAHRQRLFWLREQLSKTDRALEFGCGTGRMIALPLRAWGYDVIGVDLDPVSIEHGRALSA